MEQAKNQRYIYVSSQTLEQNNIQSNKITLHFGALTKVFNIKIDNGLKPGKVIFPHKLTESITIPKLPYEYFFKNGHLFVGPVIGMQVLPKYYRDPNKELMRFAQYDKIKGLVFLFQRDGIDRENKTITGYYYDPDSKGFVKGTFPYPSAIFNRTPMKEASYQHLREHIGDNIFNYPYGNVDKWTFWDIASKLPANKEHLPHTKKYSVKNLMSMLNEHDAVYLKPTKLEAGKGILRIKKLNKGYLLSDVDGNRIRMNSRANLPSMIKQKIKVDRAYIIQQAIPFNVNGHKIDFRVYFQKDETKKWKYSGMETKVAKKGSIISNSSNRKKIMPGEKALKRFYGLDEVEVQKKVKEISKICITVLQTMSNQWEHLGDAAVDMVIDGNGKVWLLEVQLKYAAEIKVKRSRDERRIVPKILPTPFKYAKALAGF